MRNLAYSKDCFCLINTLVRGCLGFIVPPMSLSIMLSDSVYQHHSLQPVFELDLATWKDHDWKIGEKDNWEYISPDGQRL